MMDGGVHARIVRLSGRCSDQQGFEGLGSAQLFEQEANVVNQVQIVRKVRSNVVQVRRSALELSSPNRFENRHKGRLCCSEAPPILRRPWHPTFRVLDRWSGLNDGRSFLQSVHVGQIWWRDGGGRCLFNRGRDVRWLIDGVQIREFRQRIGVTP